MSNTNIAIARLKSEINAAIYRVVDQSHHSESPTPSQIAHALAMAAGDWAKMACDKESDVPEKRAAVDPPTPEGNRRRTESAPPLPPGYLLLTHGEIIKPDNIFLGNDKDWLTVTPVSVGKMFNPETCVPFARPLSLEDFNRTA